MNPNPSLTQGIDFPRTQETARGILEADPLKLIREEHRCRRRGGPARSQREFRPNDSRKHDSEACTPSTTYWSGSIVCSTCRGSERSRQLRFPQRRLARDRHRAASTADVGGPAPNFSMPRPNLAEATKLRSMVVGGEVVLLAPNGISDFNDSRKHDSEACTPSTKYWSGSIVCLTCRGSERSCQQLFPQRRPARDRYRTASTADVGGPAPNFSTTRPNLAEATKLLTSEEKTCAIAGSGVDFKIMAGRCMLRRDVMMSDLRRGSTRMRASCGLPRANYDDTGRIGEAR
jgi:hypothetical protein